MSRCSTRRLEIEEVDLGNTPSEPSFLATPGAVSGTARPGRKALHLREIHSHALAMQVGANDAPRLDAGDAIDVDPDVKRVEVSASPEVLGRDANSSRLSSRTSGGFSRLPARAPPSTTPRSNATVGTDARRRAPRRGHYRRPPGLACLGENPRRPGEGRAHGGENSPKDQWRRRRDLIRMLVEPESAGRRFVGAYGPPLR